MDKTISEHLNDVGLIIDKTNERAFVKSVSYLYYVFFPNAPETFISVFNNLWDNIIYADAIVHFCGALLINDKQFADLISLMTKYKKLAPFE